MGTLYHGSPEHGITKLTPHKSTHGNYVYATTDKYLPIIFAGRSGDDLTFTLYRNSPDEPWIIVERIPGAFEKMFNNSASIYTLDDATFKDIHTGFCEVVSEEEVPIKSEERIDNVYDKIKELGEEGKIKIYTYPNKPKEIPADDSDLIEKEIKQAERNNSPLTKDRFARLILLHPNLLDKVNAILEEQGLDTYSKEDLVTTFERLVVFQAIDPNHEQYLESAVISISHVYPELVEKYKEKIQFLKKSDKERTAYLLDFLPTFVPDLSSEKIEELKEKYKTDTRPFREIATDIIKEIKEYSKNVNSTKTI